MVLLLNGFHHVARSHASLIACLSEPDELLLDSYLALGRMRARKPDTVAPALRNSSQVAPVKRSSQ
jgi:hypothetical protein